MDLEGLQGPLKMAAVVCYYVTYVKGCWIHKRKRNMTNCLIFHSDRDISKPGLGLVILRISLRGI